MRGCSPRRRAPLLPQVRSWWVKHCHTCLWFAMLRLQDNWFSAPHPSSPLSWNGVISLPEEQDKSSVNASRNTGTTESCTSRIGQVFKGEVGFELPTGWLPRAETNSYESEFSSLIDLGVYGDGVGCSGSGSFVCIFPQPPRPRCAGVLGLH